PGGAQRRRRRPRPRASRAADLEPPEALGRLLDDLDPVDLGAAWPLLAPADHRLDRLRIAFEDGLDRSVGPVPRPARNAPGPRRVRGRIAAADPLDEAADDHPASEDAIHPPRVLDSPDAPPRREDRPPEAGAALRRVLEAGAGGDRPPRRRDRRQGGQGADAGGRLRPRVLRP